jgi:hypothetical protein
MDAGKDYLFRCEQATLVGLLFEQISTAPQGVYIMDDSLRVGLKKHSMD